MVGFLNTSLVWLLILGLLSESSLHAKSSDQANASLPRQDRRTYERARSIALAEKPRFYRFVAQVTGNIYADPIIQSCLRSDECVNESLPKLVAESIENQLESVQRGSRKAVVYTSLSLALFGASVGFVVTPRYARRLLTSLNFSEESVVVELAENLSRAFFGIAGFVMAVPFSRPIQTSTSQFVFQLLQGKHAEEAREKLSPMESEFEAIWHEMYGHFSENAQWTRDVYAFFLFSVEITLDRAQKFFEIEDYESAAMNVALILNQSRYIFSDVNPSSRLLVLTARATFPGYTEATQEFWQRVIELATQIGTDKDRSIYLAIVKDWFQEDLQAQDYGR